MLEGYIECCWLKWSRIWEPYRTRGTYQGVYSLNNLNMDIEDFGL